MSTIDHPRLYLTPPRPERGLEETAARFADRLERWEEIRADAVARTLAARREWEREHGTQAAGAGSPPRNDPPTATAAPADPT
jgi:hypothetical protein